MNTNLDSVPNFGMSEFYAGSPFTKNIGKEVLFLLLTFGMNINQLNFDGLTPLQYSIVNKLKSLYKILLTGYVVDLDPNVKSQNSSYKD